MSSRRDWLRGAVASTAIVSCSSLVWTGRARASDLSLADRLRLLYSNQFHFNDRGEPQITVGLVQNIERVELSAAGGLLVLPSGAGGTTIEGGTRFVVTLVRAKPAKQRFAVVLEELAGPAMATLDRAASKWRDKGFDPSDHEVGTVFGVSGRVLDNRRILLVAESLASEDEAHRRAEVLRQRNGALAKLHPIISERASGAMLAEDPEHGLKIAADGVLW